MNKFFGVGNGHNPVTGSPAKKAQKGDRDKGAPAPEQAEWMKEAMFASMTALCGVLETKFQSNTRLTNKEKN